MADLPAMCFKHFHNGSTTRYNSRGTQALTFLRPRMLFRTSPTELLCSNVLSSSSSSSSSSSCKWFDGKYLFHIPMRPAITAIAKPIERCHVYPTISLWDWDQDLSKCPLSADLSASKESASSTWTLPSHLSSHRNIHKLLLFDRKHHTFAPKRSVGQKWCASPLCRTSASNGSCSYKRCKRQQDANWSGWHRLTHFTGRDILTQ